MRRLVVLSIASLIFCLLASLCIHKSVWERTAMALTFWGLSQPILFAATSVWRDKMEEIFGNDRGQLIRYGYGAYLFGWLALERIANGHGDDLWGLALYIGIALIISSEAPPLDKPRLVDLLLVAWLWLPIECGFISGSFLMLRLAGTALLIFFYVIERPIWNPGAIVPTRRADWAWGLGVYLAFILVAVPFAIWSGFAWPGVADKSNQEGWLLFLLSVYWVTALPEEALFRGTIQELFSRIKGIGEVVALLAASVIFGLSHLNNHSDAPVDGTVADWRYLVLATLAGVAYGTAYVKTKRIAAPLLAHFLVDVTWRGFFAGA